MTNSIRKKDKRSKKDLLLEISNLKKRLASAESLIEKYKNIPEDIEISQFETRLGVGAEESCYMPDSFFEDKVKRALLEELMSYVEVKRTNSRICPSVVKYRASIYIGVKKNEKDVKLDYVF